jgi:integrase
MLPNWFPLCILGNALMVQTAITDQALKRIAPAPGKRIELWDAYLEGFGYRATQKGKGNFFVMFRFEGKQRRHTIGRYPIVSLEEARDLARDALKKAKSGTDPSADRAAQTEADRERRARTVSAAVADFLTLYPRYRPSTRAEVKRLLNREVVPEVGDMPISTVGRKDIARVVNLVADRGARTTANRLFSYLQALFGWLVDRGELDTTPFINLHKPSPEHSRDRVLSDVELACVWKAADGMSYPFGHFVQLLILTAQRRDEVAGMRRMDLDIAEQVWALPREQTKSDRTHRVPLSPLAAKIIGTLPKHDEMLLFPATRRRKKDALAARHISGWSAFKRTLDKKAHEQFRVMVERINGEKRNTGPTTIKPWTLHDLRRTVASGMAALGVAPHVVERLLNHSAGAIRGVAAVYNRYSYVPEMRLAVEIWAEHVTGIIHPSRMADG